MPVHHTPLRRISQGSLHQSASAGQLASSPSPTGLDFLPIHDLVDELETLNQNLEVMERLTSSLAKFNEGFAMFSYGLRMSAFSVEWSEAPDETTWERVALEEERERQHQGRCRSRVPLGVALPADRLSALLDSQRSSRLRRRLRRDSIRRRRCPTRPTGTAAAAPTRLTTPNTRRPLTRTKSAPVSSIREGPLGVEGSQEVVEGVAQAAFRLPSAGSAR
jgi:hypothetical protein